MSTNTWGLIGQAYQIGFMFAFLGGIIYFWRKEVKENGWF